MKSDKYKSNNNKGYVFTLMPLYAIGVGVFAAYKFLKVATLRHTLPLSNAITEIEMSYLLLRRRSSLQITKHKRISSLRGPKSQRRQVCLPLCLVWAAAARIWLRLICIPVLFVFFDTENQLNELEQRLAQTERMLNSILTQLDPLTNWSGFLTQKCLLFK